MKSVLHLQNIKCGGCGSYITKRLNAIDGISNTQVDPEEGTVTFESVDLQTIDLAKSTLSKMGYPEDNTTLLQSATSYVSCMLGRMSKDENITPNQMEIK